MITKDQIQNRIIHPGQLRRGAMTIDQVVQKYGVPTHVVTYQIKLGTLVRVPTTDRKVHITTRSVEQFFANQEKEGE